MPVKYICDGCGKESPADNTPRGFFKPRAWFERGDEDGTQIVCSRECIEKVAKASGKTACVLPI